MRSGSGGFTIVSLLVVLAVCLTGLAVARPMWSQQVKREREQELLRVGALYARAIASYRNASPGSLKQNPPTLQALLVDTRFIGLRRHLRTLYPDPIDPRQPWGLVLDADQRVAGVYSQSAEAPVAEAAVDLGDIALAPARHYADWRFTLKATP